ncbi:DHA2 family efflux MFS transporter permease subunit [Porticoccaceae bacterium]|nr:DHA2 family efflux MFS transporter permease subunit [Porticoccaceae bacterium]
MSTVTELSPSAKSVVTIAVMLAAIMQVLDTTIANVALPHMQGSLSATQEQLAWVLTSYIVASAIMTLPVGWLAGRYGCKSVFVISVAGFTAASVLCGAASTLNEMIFFRVLQGIFGAALVPLSQTVLLNINRKEDHPKAMGLWSASIMIGPILGPTLGGALTEYYSWRWSFYINLPIGIMAFLIMLAVMPNTEKVERPFDKLGFFTLSVTIACLQLILDRGQHVDWFDAAEIQLYCALILSSLWVYILHTRTADNPFLSPAVLRDRNFMVSLAFMFFVGLVLLASMALMPPYLQNLMGYPILDIGFILAPRGLGTMFGMIVVAKIGARVDTRIVILFGLLTAAYSLSMMTEYNDFVPRHMLIESGLLQGFGLGCIFMPLSNIAYLTMPEEHRAEAAGLFSLVRNLGGSIGVSIAFALLSRDMQTHHSYLNENITPYTFVMGLQQFPQEYGTSLSVLLAGMNNEISRQAAAISYINSFYFMMWIMLAITPLIFLLKGPAGKKITV